MTLLPQNATALERAVEKSIARDQQIPIRSLWDADNCPEHLLPWLAWALHVDIWDLAKDAETRRAVIRESAKLHRLKGTRWAVQQALATLRVKSEITEWWQQQPPGDVHTFGLLAWVNENLTGDSAILSAALYERLRDLIDEVKPARSHYQFRIGAQFEQRTRIANGSQTDAVGRWSAEPVAVQPPPSKTSLIAASAVAPLAISKQSVEPAAVQPPPAIHAMRHANVARSLPVIRFSMEIA